MSVDGRDGFDGGWRLGKRENRQLYTVWASAKTAVTHTSITIRIIIWYIFGQVTNSYHGGRWK
jgi:hypothetical protein